LLAPPVTPRHDRLDRSRAQEQSEKFLGSYRHLGERLAATKPDTIVALTVEHWPISF